MNTNERGSAAIETVVIAPVLILLIALIIFGGRVALTHQVVEGAAADAARAASLERSQAKARTAANAAVERALSQDLPCTAHRLALDVSGFNNPVGTPAQVRATLTCDVATTDLGLPGLGRITVQATMTNPLDTYRERR